MNCRAIPVLTPYTYPSHMGPGCERGKPFYDAKRQYEMPTRAVRGAILLDKDKSGALFDQGRSQLNDPKNEALLYTYGDPPSHRSGATNFNMTGGLMHSLPHYAKIGSKHINVLQHSRSSPSLHSQKGFTDYVHPDPTALSIARGGEWTTSGQSIGQWWYRERGQGSLMQQF